MSAATLTFGADSSALRQTLALSISLLLHLTLAFVILLSIRREVPPPPLEISIFEGAKGPASPPPGDKSAEPGPERPPSDEARHTEATTARPASQTRSSRVKVAARPHPTPKPGVPERPVEEQALIVALKSSNRAPITRAWESAQSSVAQRETPTGVPGAARPEADDAAGSAVGTAREGSGSPQAEAGSHQLPGPGGGGSGWSSGSSGTGVGGGGTGRSGFSVSGAGAGGAGRSYASIWEWTQRYLSGLRSAYNDELRSEAALRGVIVVRYEILGSGAVGKVTILSSELRDPHFEREVLKQISGWRYPPEPAGTVVVTWPFSFRPTS